MAQIDNLTLDIRQDGVFLTFIAPGGATATVDVERLAAREEEVARAALLAWCQDQRKRTTAERTDRLLAQDYAD